MSCTLLHRHDPLFVSDPRPRTTYPKVKLIHVNERYVVRKLACGSRHFFSAPSTFFKLCHHDFFVESGKSALQIAGLFDSLHSPALDLPSREWSTQGNIFQEAPIVQSHELCRLGNGHRASGPPTHQFLDVEATRINPITPQRDCLPEDVPCVGRGCSSVSTLECFLQGKVLGANCCHARCVGVGSAL